MTTKKTVIMLDEPARKSAVKLESMVAELIGDTQPRAIANAKAAQWSRRFAASGKNFAPRIRAS